ncbi:MAG: hypothetical protein ABL886_05040 [Rhodoglobus sp.]
MADFGSIVSLADFVKNLPSGRRLAGIAGAPGAATAPWADHTIEL